MDSMLFPISADKHVTFCIIATLLFWVQFFRTKRWYQLVMAVAVPFSLLIYVAPENEVVYYGVGAAEAVMLVLAFILNIVQSILIAKEEKKKKAAEPAAQGTEA